MESNQKPNIVHMEIIQICLRIEYPRRPYSVTLFQWPFQWPLGSTSHTNIYQAITVLLTSYRTIFQPIPSRSCV